MRLKLNVPLCGADGKVLKESVDGESRPMVLGRALYNAMSADRADADTGRPLDKDMKFKQYQLSKRLAEAMTTPAGELDVSIEEANLLKTATGTLFPPVVLGPVWDALEAASKSPLPE